MLSSLRAPGPDGWRPGRELGKQTERTGKVLPDQVVHHAGNARPGWRTAIRATSPCWNTPRSVPRPKARRSFWPIDVTRSAGGSKASGSKNADAGPILMMNVVSNDRGREYHIFSAEDAPLPRGTFDWQQRQLTFVTDQYATAAIFSFQLRWAPAQSGTMMASLEDWGPVVPVETY